MTVEPAQGRRPDPAFWRDRRVFVTGHTGFKGGWLCLMLSALGAETNGFALPPEPEPNPYAALDVGAHLTGETLADLRDAAALSSALTAARPHIVLHLAAEAIVSRAMADPARTFAVNLGGTVNLLDALRLAPSRAQALVAVTSDKVYRQAAEPRPFREDDPLGGGDPYSASKAACELAVAAYRHTYAQALPPMATARAGNVIGGGDFGQDRLIPDLIRAERSGQPLQIRHPDATRPFQHVLDVLCGYLLVAEDLAQRPDETPHSLNFGPDAVELRVRDLLDRMGEARGRPLDWRTVDPGPLSIEAPRLALDSGLARQRLDWRPQLDSAQMLRDTWLWYEAWLAGKTTVPMAQAQVLAFLKL